MKTVLLIIIACMSLVTMICSIISATMITNESKSKDRLKKALKMVSIICLILIVLVLAVSVSFIKGDSNSNQTITTTESQSASALESAGFNKVTLSEYLDLIKKSEKSIILVARPTCGYCEKFTPILKQAMEDMNLTINYVDTDSFSEDDWTTFNSSLDYLNSEEWGTPLVLIVQDGKVLAENSGYVELTEIKNFFTNNGFGE